MKYKKIIFLDEENTFWSPLAEMLLKQKLERCSAFTGEVHIVSRGNVVLFPEPANQKAAEIACENGLSISDHAAVQMTNEDFSEDTLVLALDNDSKLKAYSKYTEAAKVFTLREYVGQHGDIKFQPGRAVAEYADVYNVLDQTLEMLKDKLLKKTTDNQPGQNR